MYVQDPETIVSIIKMLKIRWISLSINCFQWNDSYCKKL